tara:strand:+ start:139 stop:549 length:411 start_codon:yes stop_codon:yes gene_type:complete
LLGVLAVIFFILIVFYEQTNLNSFRFEEKTNNLSDADISEPKFAINNETKKIYITASEGNFLNKDEVLLRNNVRFKSNNFSIETDKVVFNRNQQTAQSKTRSLFKSENITISSDGFNIHDKGNKIIFHGNSYIILK